VTTFAYVGCARTEGLASLNSNDNLVLAGTLHGIHAITSRLSPTGISSGAHIIEAETFKMTIFLTATGERGDDLAKET
jgi:trafficking protein particle complex subunit 4